MSLITVQMLQTPAIYCDGKPVTLPYKKVYALFYYLICCGQATRQELMNLLWEGEPTSSAQKNLRHALHSLRKGLGEVLVSEGKQLLRLSPQAHIQCDLWDFLRYNQLSSYHNGFLPGFSVKDCEPFDTFLREQTNYLHQRYLSALLSTAQCHIQQEELPQACALLQQYVDQEPLDEETIRLLMGLHRSLGSYRKACEIYQELCRTLSRELSLSPMRETTQLYYAIMDDWNAATSEASNPPESALLGKQEGIRHLLSAYRALLNSAASARCLVLQGEAGVGKTHLLQHFLQSLDFSDSLVLQTVCFPSEQQVPMAPWRTISLSLAQRIQSRHTNLLPSYRQAVSGLLPLLASQQSAYPPADREERTQFLKAQEAFLAVLSTLAQREPILLLFEDIHWMDPYSTQLLEGLIHRLQGQPLLVVCTCRPQLSQHLVDFLSRLMVDHLLDSCILENLTPEESQQFIRSQSTHPYTQADMLRLHQNTHGNPLLLQQLLTVLEQQDALNSLPCQPGQIITQRLALLSPPLRQLMDHLSLFPGGAPLALLSTLMQQPAQQTQQQLEQLEQQQLALSMPGTTPLRFQIAHQEISQSLIAQQQPLLRRLLHLQVVQYYECQPCTLASLEQLVYHCGQGGDRGKTLTYKVKTLCMYTELCYELLPILAAAPDARIPEEQSLAGLFPALEEELNDLQRTGISLHHLDAIRGALRLARGRFLIQKGRYTQGIPLIQALIDHCSQTEDGAILAQAYRQMAYYAIQVYRPDRLAQWVEAGLKAALTAHDPVEEAIQRRLLGYCHILHGAFDQGRLQLHQSIQLLLNQPDSGDGRYDLPIAGAHHYLGESYRLEGNWEDAYREYRQALALNRSNPYFPGIAVFYTSFGQAAYQKGDFSRSRVLIRQALDIYDRSRESSWYPVALAYSALFDTEDEHYAQAAEKMQNALGIARSIDSPLWEGLVLHLVVRIRKQLASRHHRIPVLESLWEGSVRHQCLRALSLIPPCPYAWEVEQLRLLLSSESPMDTL